MFSDSIFAIQLADPVYFEDIVSINISFTYYPFIYDKALKSLTLLSAKFYKNLT